jgi:hypothetical protein
MQYSLMLYQTDAQFAARTDPARREANQAAFGSFIGALQKAGILVTTLGIEPPATAATVRAEHRDGTPRVQRAPYADTNEQLGGLCVIEAPDLDAALAWAGRAPFEHCAAVEVRPTRVVSVA